MIKKTEPNKTSLVFKSFDTVHYRDAFKISFHKDTFQDIDDFASKYVLSQPTWLRIIRFKNQYKDRLLENI